MDIKEKVKSNDLLTLSEAIKLMLEQRKQRKFIEGIELIVNLSLGKDESLRGNSILPNGTGKSKKIIIFAPESRRNSLLEAAADRVGYEDLIVEIKSGKIEKNTIYMTSPSYLKDMKEVASILGSKGLMPNAKYGTLTDNLEGFIADMKNKATFFKSGKTNLIQGRVGSVEMDILKLTENITFFVKSILLQMKNQSSSKSMIKSMFIKTTMGKAVRIDILDFI